VNCGQAQENATPLSPKELTEFLGPLSPDAFRWTKWSGPDFDVYNGQANSPASGSVRFYLGNHPEFGPEAGSAVVKGRLGIFRLQWHRVIAKDGSIRQGALIRLDDRLQVDILVTAKTPSDLDSLVAAVAQLPTFSSKHKPH